jgi:cell division protease FtsH
MLTPGADPVRKISIVPRGHALGVTFQFPDADRYSYSASYLRGRIAGMLAGRAAEELVHGDVTTGAENDLEQATGLAKQLVGRWGMSEKVEMLSVLPDPRREQPLSLGGDGTSPATRELVETETRRILDQCYEQALETLGANRHRLDALVEALLRTETLDAANAYRALACPCRPTPSCPPIRPTWSPTRRPGARPGRGRRPAGRARPGGGGLGRCRRGPAGRGRGGPRPRWPPWSRPGCPR